MPVRKQLGTRTLFNILGPLVNPARPAIMLVGVYDPALCHPVAQALRLLGCERQLVVHGAGLGRNRVARRDHSGGTARRSHKFSLIFAR